MTQSKEIFVFGSNLAGRHGKGAALTARETYGAEYGIGGGRTGDSYAIPTKGHRLEVLELSIIKRYIDEFIEYAKSHPELRFIVTNVGCGLAGYRPEQIAPMFSESPMNCRFSLEFALLMD